MTTNSTTEECKLISGDFALFIQSTLGIAAILALVYKRRIESPKRSFEVWGFDVAKQAVGGLIAHVCNMLISLFLGNIDSGSSADECAWYFMNFFVDVVLGVPMAIVQLAWLKRLARRCNWTNLVDIGNYGDPPEFYVWAVQFGAWLVIIIFNKALLMALMLLAHGPLDSLVGWLFHPLQEYPHIELIVVMVLFPASANIIQFWILDTHLKSKPTGGSIDSTCRCTAMLDPAADSDDAASRYSATFCSDCGLCQQDGRHSDYLRVSNSGGYFAAERRRRSERACSCWPCAWGARATDTTSVSSSHSSPAASDGSLNAAFLSEDPAANEITRNSVAVDEANL